VTSLEHYGTGTLADGGCATCADAGIPVRVLEVRSTSGGGGAASACLARCEDRAGAQADIAVDFISGVRPGDILLVHAGVAIARVEEAV
jgi:hydrogenase maturation factor